jgi:hypothetical protein
LVDGKALSLAEEADKVAVGKAGITMMRCYISGIVLSERGRVVWQERGSYHLIDAENPATLMLQLPVPADLRYDAISFNLGVDSSMSTSGAHGGDLDPVKGMYWAWQSGYINFKLEGTSPVSTARKHQFQYHLGGYQPPYATLQPVRLAARPVEELIVRMDLSKFLADIDMAHQHTVMIPGAEAVSLSQKAAGIFYVQ